MSLKDITQLRDAIREVAAEIIAGGPGEASMFVRQFRLKHPDLIPEFADYMADVFLAEHGRKAVKDLRGSILRTLNAEQEDLPLEFEDLDIPTALIVPRQSGKTEWVPRDSATLADCDAYGAMLKKNAIDCFARVTDWEQLMRACRPLMEESGWRLGEAIKHLRSQGQQAA